jgi:hypothetical protein
MRKIKFSPELLLIAFALILLNSCETNPGDNAIQKEQISGYVQKGPYLIGTSISLSDLNSDLSQTGKVFTTGISNNQGAFEISNIELSSGYVEILADGFYFNELQGKNSSAQLTLSAVSNIRDKSTLNVNVLAHLEKDRLLKLVSDGASFPDAKKQAQEEILKVFLIEKSDIAESELLNIAEDGDDNAILLAVSVILQGHLPVADMSELIGKLNADLKEDGKLDDPSIGTSLINNARLANLKTVRANLEKRYEELDLDVTIPEFEKYVEYFIENSGYVFDLLPVYPEFSGYGRNVLYPERDTFYTADELSLAAELPEGTSLKVILKGGHWWYRFAPQGPKNWDISIYDDLRQQQVFTATSPGGSSDVSVSFDVEPGGQKKFTIEYYENGAETPTRTREIVVVDKNAPEGGAFLYPENGAYGPNILSMGDTISLQTGVKYSLAADFPEFDEAGISFMLSFTEPGAFTTNPAEADLWTVRQDTAYLEISASGKNIKPDMSIVFNKPASFDLFGGGMIKTGSIQ